MKAFAARPSNIPSGSRDTIRAGINRIIHGHHASASLSRPCSCMSSRKRMAMRQSLRQLHLRRSRLSCHLQTNLHNQLHLLQRILEHQLSHCLRRPLSRRPMRIRFMSHLRNHLSTGLCRHIRATLRRNHVLLAMPRRSCMPVARLSTDQRRRILCPSTLRALQ